MLANVSERVCYRMANGSAGCQLREICHARPNAGELRILENRWPETALSNRGLVRFARLTPLFRRGGLTAGPPWT